MYNLAKKAMYTIKQHPILCALFIFEVAAIIFYNLFQGKYFLGYDASTYYLQIIETWKQKKLFLDSWAWQTALFWDSPLFLAVLFYGISGNIYTSVGVSNIIFLFLFLVVLFYIMKQLEASTSAKLLFFCLLLIPFISVTDNYNNIQYYFVMYVNLGVYLPKILIIFLLFCVHYRVRQAWGKVSTAILIIVSYLGLLITSISNGYFALIFGVAPMVIMYVVDWIIENRWDRAKLRVGVYLIGCVLISFFGKLFASRVLGFESLDSAAVWNSLTQFWDNFQSIFVGYLYLTGALPANEGVPILDKIGVGFLFRFFLSMIILIGGIFGVYRTIKQIRQGKTPNYMKLQVASVITINILVFILCYTTYGSPIFESRYLIIVLISLEMFASIWWDKIIFKNENKYCKRLLNMALVISILATDVYSYYYIHYSKNEYATMEKIVLEVEKTDAPVVYLLGDELKITARNIRVIDTGHVYRYMNDINTLHGWGDYTYFSDAGENTGSSILVCNKNTYETLPAYYISQYKLYASVSETDIGIYLADRNAIDPSVGINGDYNLDYFYTQGMCTYEHGNFDEDGNFVTDGTSGFATFGPYIQVPMGTYEFTLNYTVEQSPPDMECIGEFDIAVNAASISIVDMFAQNNSATIQVSFDESYAGGALEYRSFVNDGVIIALESVSIKKID